MHIFIGDKKRDGSDFEAYFSHLKREFIGIGMVTKISNSNNYFTDNYLKQQVRKSFDEFSAALIAVEENQEDIPSKHDGWVQNHILEILAFLKKQYNEVSYGD